jgi:hypothetical protein
MEFTTIKKAIELSNLSYLGSVNKSAKLTKNGKISGQYTYGVYLAPANQSGFNACSHSTPECRMGCLNTSGRNGMEILSGHKTMTNDCRNKKTRLLFEHTSFFMNWVKKELSLVEIKAKNDGFGVSARLNCTSDIDWNKVLIEDKTIFELFPDIQFYDYTKNPNKFRNIAKNYHLTFSYTGRNQKACRELLNTGHNVAVVFNTQRNKPLPKTFGGFKVVDGDLTDYRPDDKKGVVVGLRFKRIANKADMANVLKSVFVADENKDNCLALFDRAAKELVMA